MARHLVCCFIFAVLSLASVRSAHADPEVSYDTVDAMEITSKHVDVTGIVQGQGAPTTTRYFLFEGTDQQEHVSQCQRFIMLVMSKPGRFRLAILLVSDSMVGCRLTVRTP